MKSLKEIWHKTAQLAKFDEATSANLWEEIYNAYTSKGRYYHGLAHLESIFRFTEEEELKLEDRLSLNLSIFYHDIVYDFERKDNERKSADLAIERLILAGIDNQIVNRVEDLIMATYGHEYSADQLKNLMIEADVAIIGSDFETYQKYAQNCRSEYGMYPDDIYNPARKEALSHFLSRKDLFVSEKFKEKFEANARKNLQWEIDQL